MSDEQSNEGTQYLEIRTRFARGRNVLFAVADFSSLYVDYYLHQRDNRLQIGHEEDRMLKSALALFSLHCASRPRNEVLAWTVNFQEPLLNLFLGGDTTTGDVVGRVYTENVKRAKENAFYQDLVRGNRDPHRSVVGFTGSDMIAAVETFYEYSEQRPARFFEVQPEVFGILAAHPDYDQAWFKSVVKEDMLRLDEQEEVVDIERRGLRWDCGCDQGRILNVLSPTFEVDPEGLFQNEELIEVNCSRCAGKYRITREMLEAYVAEHSGS